MPTLTDAAAVRLRFQVNDATAVPDALVTASIADAEAELLPRLDAHLDTAQPEARLALGATLLAGAHLFRALAAGEAHDAQALSIGGQRLYAGDRFRTLQALASDAEQRAWSALAPYLATPAGAPPLTATPTQPVFNVPPEN